MSIPRTSRRTFLGSAAIASLGAAGLSACGTSGPASSAAGGKGQATMWTLSGQPGQGIQQKAVDAFNKRGEGTVSVTFFQNDAYKTKIRTAVGAGHAPTLIFGWGGGILKSYADAGQVLELTDWVHQHPEVKNRFLASTWGSATFGGKIYAMPQGTTTPVLMFYNKKLFDKAGADLPKTWDDLMNLVDVFNKQGVAPLSLGGQSLWTSMMWLEYLFDRIGGPTVFDNIFNNKPNAWSDPAVIKSCQMVQQLVKAKGFVKGFSSIAADGNADQALLYTGKAAMMLHGAWVYSGMKTAQPNFVKNDLEYGAFPMVPGGKGDPKNAAGNPAGYWSISSKAPASAQKVAKAFLKDGVLQPAEVKAQIDSGSVPVVKSAEGQLSRSPDAPYLTFIFNMIKQAPHFQQSWDQALGPSQATALLNNIGSLFLLKITPQQFADKMNTTIQS